MVGSLPDVIGSSVVDPEVIGLFLPLNHFGKTVPGGWLEMGLAIVSIEVIVGIQHLGADELAIPILFNGKLDAIIASDS